MTKQQSNYIKLIAMITMLTDHIGVILFPNQIIFRIIGRIAFPLFAYQLGVGYENTKKLKKYILRILFFGILLQLIYSFAINFSKINKDLGELNIFFTLSLGLAALFCYERKKDIWLFLILILPIISENFNIRLDYGMYGIALILILYIEKNHPRRMLVFITASSLIFCYYVQGGDYTQMYCLAALFFIIKPLSLRLNIPNYIFYLFYPLHLAILYAISILAGG